MSGRLQAEHVGDFPRLLFAELADRLVVHMYDLDTPPDKAELATRNDLYSEDPTSALLTQKLLYGTRLELQGSGGHFENANYTLRKIVGRDRENPNDLPAVLDMEKQGTIDLFTGLSAAQVMTLSGATTYKHKDPKYNEIANKLQRGVEPFGRRQLGVPMQEAFEYALQKRDGELCLCSQDIGVSQQGKTSSFYLPITRTFVLSKVPTELVREILGK